MDSRPDAGALFENYIVAELKKKYYSDNVYFWRNTDQQEIDFVLEKDGELTVAKVKYSENKTAKLPSTFEDAYQPKKFTVINRENYIEEFAKI